MQFVQESKVSHETYNAIDTSHLSVMMCSANNMIRPNQVDVDFSILALHLVQSVTYILKILLHKIVVKAVEECMFHHN